MYGRFRLQSRPSRDKLARSGRQIDPVMTLAIESTHICEIWSQRAKSSNVTAKSSLLAPRKSPTNKSGQTRVQCFAASQRTQGYSPPQNQTIQVSISFLLVRAIACIHASPEEFHTRPSNSLLYQTFAAQVLTRRVLQLV